MFWWFFFLNGSFDWLITKNIMKLCKTMSRMWFLYLILHSFIKPYKCICFYTYTFLHGLNGY
jgi:hypothetical protein